jgi:hypothetical protein
VKLTPIVHNPGLTGPVEEKPSFAAKLRHAMEAGVRFAESGMQMAPADAKAQRAAICQACSYWNPEGNAGMGECTHFKCGCTKLKWSIASERCPLTPPKWTRVDI